MGIEKAIMLIWKSNNYDANLESKQPKENSIVHRQIVSIAQDIIHSTLKGRICTPKHILLPLTIHNMTGRINSF